MAKLTREQVSQLSDVELNRGMAWLFAEHVAVTILGGGTYKYTSGISDRNGTNLSIFAYDDHESIDFLTDYNLTMPLVIKHKILHSIHYCASGLDNKPIYKACGQLKCRTESEYCPTLLRAYCECLVLTAMEREV